MNILIVHNHIPKPDRGGSELRLSQLIDVLGSEGHSLTFVSLNQCSESKYFNSLVSCGVEVFAGDSERLTLHGIQIPRLWAFKEVIEGHSVDLVILTLWFWNQISIPEHYMDDIRTARPNVPVCVLMDDRHGLRQRQLAAFSHSFTLWESANDYVNRESEIYRRCNAVLAIAPAEAKTARTVAPDVPVFILPFSAPVSADGRSFEKRTGILFVANFSNIAALHSMSWFLRSIWPEIRARLPNVSATIAGTKSREVLPRPIRGISVLGHVDDCADIFGSHRVFVSPIPYGTGIATKNVMAMSFGIPVVTTHFGATSLEIISGVHALISDRADGIADEVVKLYTNPGLWKSIAENGAAHIRDQFSQLRLEEGVREFLSTQISSQLDSYAVGKRSIHLMDRIDPSLREAPSRLECTKIRVGWHLETGDDFVSHHDFESALIQYRHACSWVANSLAHFPEYGRLLVGFRKCYTALNDCEGIHRCELELGRTKQTIPK